MNTNKKNKFSNNNLEPLDDLNKNPKEEDSV